MIKVTHVINAKLRGKLSGRLKGTQSHKVCVEVTGARHLAQVAAGMADKPELAEQVRRARKFTFTVPAEKWAAIEKGMS